MRDSPAAAGAVAAAGAGAVVVGSVGVAVVVDTAAGEVAADSAAAHPAADFPVAGGLPRDRVVEVADALRVVAVSTAVRHSVPPVGGDRAAESPVVGVR